ncbi:MAG TPA: hypothetical protein VHR97_14715 [Candidatus Baltobacteraceae bacterium]|jgi:hypothetical protein|nr:hypothetical protein [Candidatus Baltobacteraceae bacterium]
MKLLLFVGILSLFVAPTAPPYPNAYDALGRRPAPRASSFFSFGAAASVCVYRFLDGSVKVVWNCADRSNQLITRAELDRILRERGVKAR